MPLDLDDVLNVQSEYYDDGFHQGQKKGQEEGYNEGWVFGVEKAMELTCEVGEIKGFIDSLENLAKSNQNMFSTRVYKCIYKLKQMISEFKIDDPHAETLTEDFHAIQEKHKQLKLLLGQRLQKKQKEIEQELSF
eukprot:gb/GECH01011744.1/.p1 GENE.gb/GECH01011744.1/~~gb/GECH01011744.1/.p1  ORF type:complete len:135 (+),score=49.27 gb/GECH01011744.1/:1-405(+)